MTFDQWLEWYFVDEVAEGVLDDDLPDATDNWIANLTKSNFAHLAAKYGNEMAAEYVVRNNYN